MNRCKQAYPTMVISTLLAAIEMLAAPGTCRAIHVDYLVEQDTTGQLVTGTNDFDTNTQTIQTRLFHRDLDTNFFGSDPGFSAVSPINVPDGYLALPANTPVSFDLLAMPLYASTVANLWYWNGVGAVNFQPMTGGTRLTVSIGFNKAIVDGSAADVTGFALQVTDATGAIHRHPNYQLSGGPGGTPPEGLYMIAEHVRMPGLQTSIPFYTMFVTDAISNAAYDAAVAWGTGHLLIPGDVNNDGIVNLTDLTAVASHWQQAGPAADGNYDGIVNLTDLTLIASHWMQSSSGDIATIPVPEPPAARLCLTAAVVALWARLRRNVRVVC